MTQSGTVEDSGEMFTAINTTVTPMEPFFRTVAVLQGAEQLPMGWTGYHDFGHVESTSTETPSINDAPRSTSTFGDTEATSTETTSEAGTSGYTTLESTQTDNIATRTVMHHALVTGFVVAVGGALVL